MVVVAVDWATWWRLAACSVPPALAAPSRRQGFVLTTPQLRDAGVARHVVRREVAADRWCAPCRGVVAPVDVRGPDAFETQRRRHAVASAGMALLNRGHVVCGPSAAVLHGLPTLDIPATPCLTVVPSRGTGRRRTREAGLRREDLQFWWGIAVTGVARTVADLARHDRAAGLVAADAALHAGAVSAAGLAAAADQMRHWPGIATAREVLALADPRIESPLESLTRLALHDDGFPPPEPQVEIAVPGRGLLYRVDFLWRLARLVLEVDGRGKYDFEELRRERRREADLRALGYRIERVMWHDVVHDWPRTAALLRRALAAATSSPTSWRESGA